MARYITVFDRRLEIYLNNMTLKESLLLFICNMKNELDLILSNSKTTKKTRAQLHELSRLLEYVGWHFLEWVDHSFHSVFDKHQIFWARKDGSIQISNWTATNGTRSLSDSGRSTSSSLSTDTKFRDKW
jgi:hypothetical protein